MHIRSILPSVPASISAKGCEEDPTENMKEYQAIFRSLIYLVIDKKPDVAHTVTQLGQFASCQNENHMRAAKRTLRYLNGIIS